MTPATRPGQGATTRAHGTVSRATRTSAGASEPRGTKKRLGGSRDFLNLAAVIVDRDLSEAAYHARAVTYSVALPPSAPLPPARPYQNIRRLGPGRLELTISRPVLPKPSGITDRNHIPKRLRPYLLPSGMLPVRAPLIQKLAKMARGKASTDVRTAKNLTTFVNRYIIHKGYSLPAATALDVARLRRGDCSEHAVLLAALARAVGIPARLLSGLVYAGTDAKGHYRFMYHMWTEMNLSGKWLPFDATRPDPGVGPTHILLAVDSGNDLLPVAATTVLSRVLGAMSLKVIRIQGSSPR